MNPSTHNPFLGSPVSTRQLLDPARRNPSVPRDAEEGRPVGEIETSGTVSITEGALEPCSDSARHDTKARVAGGRQRGVWAGKEDVREFIKAGAIIGATILALRLYAAVASPSPW